VAQHRARYIFLVPTGYMENWILVSIPSGGTLLLDGGPLSAGCERAGAGMAGAATYEAVRCPVPEGSHTVSSTDKFGMLVQGWGPGPVSYGYTAGMEFKTVNNDCVNDAECPAEFFCSGGTCVPVIVIQ
jgi:hypothetical protein